MLIEAGPQTVVIQSSGSCQVMSNYQAVLKQLSGSLAVGKTFQSCYFLSNFWWVFVLRPNCAAARDHKAGRVAPVVAACLRHS